MPEMLSYQDALAVIRSLPFSAEVEQVPLLEAGGRILAGSVVAPFALPRFDNSSMDGFAVRCADLEAASQGRTVALPIQGESAAGHPFQGSLAPQSAIRISTGAKMPDGADGVVPIELAQVSADTHSVAFRGPTVPGRFIRRQGEDVPLGAPLFGAGTRLEPATLAFLAMYNLPTLAVFRRPRVAVFTSGEEVKPLGAELRETDIVGVNVYYLLEELRAFGCEPRLFGFVPDDAKAWRETFREANAWGDLVVTTAGVSVGDHDVVGRAIAYLGGKVHFWKAAVRPGKPMLVAEVGGKPFFGLPGNPVSVCCNTEIFLKPFLRQALALAPVESPREPMRLLNECPRDGQRLFFVYARCGLVRERWCVEALPHQSSGNLLNPARGNALIVLEPAAGAPPVSAGSEVPVMRIVTGR